MLSSNLILGFNFPLGSRVALCELFKLRILTANATVSRASKCQETRHFDVLLIEYPDNCQCQCTSLYRQTISTSSPYSLCSNPGNNQILQEAGEALLLQWQFSFRVNHQATRVSRTPHHCNGFINEGKRKMQSASFYM